MACCLNVLLSGQLNGNIPQLRRTEGTRVKKRIKLGLEALNEDIHVTAHLGPVRGPQDYHLQWVGPVGAGELVGADKKRDVGVEVSYPLPVLVDREPPLARLPVNFPVHGQQHGPPHYGCEYMRASRH